MTVYGIDYGTSNSCISYYDNNHRKIRFLDINGSIILKSVITIINDTPLIGINIQNEDSILCPKRLLQLEDRNSIKYSSLILKKLREATGKDYIDAVVTIPVNYNTSQREATKVACELAKINVVKLINEPTAIAIAYGVKEDNIIVLDIGAGTTDICRLEYDSEDNMYIASYVSGDSQLGGEDINIILYNKLSLIIPEINSFQKSYLLLEQIKKDFLKKDHIKVYNTVILRRDFIFWCTSFYRKILDLIESANNNCTKILLAGGGSNLVGLKEAIEDRFPKLIIYKHSNLNTLVSQGASIYGYSLNSSNTLQENKITLIDILPLSIGVECENNSFIPIIEQGSIIPINKSKVFGITEDNERYIDIKIYQGNRKLCADNYLIGTVSIDLLKERNKNEVRIEITFNIDVNSILSVNIKELRNSIETSTFFSKDNLKIDEKLLADIIKSTDKYKSMDIMKEKEYILLGKLYEYINILQLEELDISVYNQVIKNLDDNLEKNIYILENTIKSIKNDYSKYLDCDSKIDTFDPNEISNEYTQNTQDSFIELLELIEFLLTKKLSKENTEYLIQIKEVIENNKEHTLDLMEVRSKIENTSFDEEDEYNYLVKTLLTNIETVNITIEQQNKLKTFISDLEKQNISYTEKIKILNSYCTEF